MRILILLSAFALWAAFAVSDHYPPWTAFHGEACAFLSLLLLVFGCLAQGARAVRIPREAIIILAFALVPWGQHAFGMIPFTGTAWLFSLYLYGFALAWCAGAACADVPDPFIGKAFLTVVLISAVMTASINLYQALGEEWLGIWIAPVAAGDRSGGNLAQPNHAALLIVIGLLAAVHAFEQRAVGVLALTCILVMLSFGLAATQSRGAGGALLWVLFASLLGRRRAGGRFPSWGWASVVASTFVLGALFPGLVATALDPSFLLDGPSVRPERVAIGYRPLHWRILFDAVTKNPWFGYGAGEVTVAHTLAGLRHPPVMEWLTYSHNILLDLVVWFGLPLGGVVALMASIWFAQRFWQVRTASQWALSAAIGCFGVFALLEYPHAYAYFLLPCGVAAGLLGGARGAVGRVPKWGGGMGALGLVVMLAVTAVDYLKVEADFRELRMQQARIGGGEVDAQAPRLMVLDQLETMLHAARVRPVTGMDVRELDRIKEVATRYLYGAVLSNAALAFGLNGRVEDASLMLHIICHRHHPRYCEETLRHWCDVEVPEHPALGVVELPGADERVVWPPAFL